ncbi:hypothetical protein ACQEVZ_49620 [Dactylosporangium sp. CA-152071]|uniref:hypothetical protein n=1 Tax=Dactylosporangium sp. CA-152071 TaxID=3239933 RepID=UPI003D8DEE02
MGIMTDYFVATAGRAAAVVEHGPAGEPDLPTLEMKWVEPAVLGSSLWAIIEGVPAEGDRVPLDLDRYDAAGEIVGAADGYGHGVLRIADGFVRALAGLADDRIPAVAAVWSRCEEWIGDWEPGELDDTVLGLRDLAREVTRPDLGMYMWWSGP